MYFKVLRCMNHFQLSCTVTSRCRPRLTRLACEGHEPTSTPHSSAADTSLPIGESSRCKCSVQSSRLRRRMTRTPLAAQHALCLQDLVSCPLCSLSRSGDPKIAAEVEAMIGIIKWTKWLAQSAAHVERQHVILSKFSVTCCPTNNAVLYRTLRQVPAIQFTWFKIVAYMYCRHTSTFRTKHLHF